MKSINVSPLSGFRDFGKKDQANRLWLIDTALKVYERFGYLPIETPALEREEILQGQYGEEGDSLRYRMADRGIGLRYDLTIPFSRYVAKTLPAGEIRLPFRRSQVGPVWRAESPQAGRYREFYQCDFDIAGSSEAWSDAEIILVAYSLLKELGFDFQLRISSRSVMDGIIRLAGIPDDKAKDAMVMLDKLEKMGRKDVEASLVETFEVPAKAVKLFLDTVTDEKEFQSSIEHLDDIAKTQLDKLQKAIESIKAVVDEPERIVLDLSIIRGLAYYTGTVLETKVVGAEKFGSILSGGRFDNTVGTFLGRQVPAVGASLGVDRCLEVMKELNLLPEGKGLSDVAILPFPDQEQAAVKLASDLRKDDLSVVFFPGSKNLSAAVTAARQVARFAVIVGENEVKAGKYQIRNLESGERLDASQSEIQKVVHL